MIFIAVIGALALSLTLIRGGRPYLTLGRIGRHGAKPAMYWLSVVVEIALIVVGLAGHLSN